MTLVEVLVALAIIGVLLLLLLPAVQAAREASRRVTCSANLRQLAFAMHQYEAVHQVLPKSSQRNYSFHVAILPHLEQQELYSRFDFSTNMLDYVGPLYSQRVPIFECPSDGVARQVIGGQAATSYQGNAGSGAQRYGFNGLFGHSHARGSLRYLPLSGVTDGLSVTAMLSEALPWDGSYHPRRVVYLAPGMATPEQLDDFADFCRTLPQQDPGNFNHTHVRGRPWFTAGLGWTLYNHILTPNSPSCWNGANSMDAAYSATSFHSRVVNMAYADGSVHAINESIELSTWRQLGSRNGL